MFTIPTEQIQLGMDWIESKLERCTPRESTFTYRFALRAVPTATSLRECTTLILQNVMC